MKKNGNKDLLPYIGQKDAVSAAPYEPLDEQLDNHPSSPTANGSLIQSGAGTSAIAISVGILLAMQQSSFVMLRSYLVSDMCDSQVLMWSEILKVAVSLGVGWREVRHIFERGHLAIVPVATYGAMNLLSFWSLKRLPANVSIIIIQLKTMWTALFARVFLQQPLLTPRSFALVTLVFGCIAITAEEGKERGEDVAAVGGAAADGGDGGSSPNGLDSLLPGTFILAILALTLEALLSGLMSVYMERIFEMRPSVMWRRNLQLALLSVGFYYLVATTHGAAGGGTQQGGGGGAALEETASAVTLLGGGATRQPPPPQQGAPPQGEACSPHTFVPDLAGWILALVSAAGGLLVAIALLYAGAVGKAVATSASIALTILAQAAFIDHAPPSVERTALCLIVLNAVVMYAVVR